MSTGPILWLHQLGMQDLEQVGGKNASLGEMIRHLSEAGVSVPGGFATTADAYRAFLTHNGLAERIAGELASLDVDDVNRLAEGRSIGHRIGAGPAKIITSIREMDRVQPGDVLVTD